MREIIICEYDPKWPFLFAEERLRIAEALSFAPAIEHVGSTAVPGLAAKPVIDIMIGTENEEKLDGLIEPISLLNYEYKKEYEAEMPYRRFFLKETNGVRSHHIHAVALSHTFWRRHLVFRDHLRSNPLDRAQYEALKRRLADDYRFDPDSYTNAKGAFIQQIIAKATYGEPMPS